MEEFSADEFINIIIPIYDRHFTQDEIRDIIRFYESPTGRKLTEKQPLITEESMMAGQEWGMKIGESIQKKLIKDGYLDI